MAGRMRLHLPPPPPHMVPLRKCTCLVTLTLARRLPRAAPCPRQRELRELLVKIYEAPTNSCNNGGWVRGVVDGAGGRARTVLRRWYNASRCLRTAALMLCFKELRVEQPD